MTERLGSCLASGQYILDRRPSIGGDVEEQLQLLHRHSMLFALQNRDGIDLTRRREFYDPAMQRFYVEESAVIRIDEQVPRSPDVLHSSSSPSRLARSKERGCSSRRTVPQNSR
jgi:hypothetical protein